MDDVLITSRFLAFMIFIESEKNLIINNQTAAVSSHYCYKGVVAIVEHTEIIIYIPE